MTKPVRPRSAASLILLRQGNAGPEVLLGRRGQTARFMPGLYVFPGGVVQRADARPWRREAQVEGDARKRAARIAARAAIRETFEETGYILGRPAGGAGTTPPSLLSEIELAAREARLDLALDALVLVGRAITPTHSPIRFHARFFLADGDLAAGPLRRGEELEDVRWYPVGHGLPSPTLGVTEFMLRHAIAVWRGTAPDAIPLFRTVRGTPRTEWESSGGGPTASLA